MAGSAAGTRNVPVQSYRVTNCRREPQQGFRAGSGVAREFINLGASVNARKQDHWTPMHLSARNGHLGIVKLLLERDADIRVLNDGG
jgi:ankyrin repeat protein